MNWPIGNQTVPVWAAGDVESKSLWDMPASGKDDQMYDVSVQGGNITLMVAYGTSSRSLIGGIRTPFRATLHGAVQILAEKVVPGDAAFAKVSVKEVTSRGPCVAQSVVTGPFLRLPDAAVKATALDAVALVSGGIAVALTAQQSIPIVYPSSIVSGTVVVELEI